MSFSDSDIKKVATLARLSINDSEISNYATNISKILGLVEQINDADTTNIKPMAHPMTELTQRVREDEVTEVVDRELFQKGAPAVDAGLYLVPQVIEGKS